MRREVLEDESNTDRWMVSYADFITLLFAFFVVMYAISSVNDDKYRVLSATLAEAFAMDAASVDPVRVGEPTLAASPHIVDLADSTAFADHEYGDTFIEDPVQAAQSMLGGFAEQEGIALETNNDWVELSLDASLLFANGTTSLSNKARDVLLATVALLQRTKNPITIEGYTDNVPSRSTRYPSNWEVSSARASAVARYFVDQGVRAERISAVGYGENHPVATNATSQGRAANRRVMIVIARRMDGSRNLNATLNPTLNPGKQKTAIGVVRSTAADELAAGVVQERTARGGLLFSTEPSQQE